MWISRKKAIVFGIIINLKETWRAFTALRADLSLMATELTYARSAKEA
jgi:hypothetical protein